MKTLRSSLIITMMLMRSGVEFSPELRYIRSEDNVLADDLSRGRTPDELVTKRWWQWEDDVDIVALLRLAYPGRQLAAATDRSGETIERVEYSVKKLLVVRNN